MRPGWSRYRWPSSAAWHWWWWPPGWAALLAGWHLSLVIAIYGVINVAYSLGLKNEPILDLAIVSAGFVLRAVAGGVAADVALSNWFLIVTSFGSLLIVTGKRSGEKQLLDEHAPTGTPSDRRSACTAPASCGRSAR